MSDAELLLLADPSPALRFRVLTELLDVPVDDPEAADLAGRRDTGLEAALAGAAGGADLRWPTSGAERRTGATR